ncbi:MAG: ATP-binding protein [Verrucomicrobiaceae bacterium]
MLLRLAISNFLSIDSSVEFLMIASKESRHIERVAEGGGMPARVLQTAAIWGGNAAGKSNLCRGLDYAQHMVVRGTRPDGPTGRIPFRLREAAATAPSQFELDILILMEGEERMFRYAFAVTGREVVTESLVELRVASEKTYFTRRAPEGGGGEPVFTLDWWERGVVPDEDRQFARFVAKGTKPNQLFLHEAMDRNLTLLAPIFRWFRDELVVLGPQDDFHSLEVQESGRQELRDYMAGLLGRADTGITSVEAVEVPVSALNMPKSLQDELMASMKEEEGGVLFRSPRGERFSVFLKNGELMASRIVTYRESKEGKKVAFETRDESDGTLRLFDLAPVLHDLDTPGCRRVYVIDELDRSMHTQLTEALVRNYCDTRSKNTRTQLIFTTHDAMLIDQDLLRRDEMWFIERGKDGDTMLESLSDYKDVRYDKDVRKAYLEGRFSGLPRLKPFVRRQVHAASVEQMSFHLNEDPATYGTTRRRKS